MKRKRRRFNPTSYLLLGGTMLAGFFLALDNPALQGLKASLRWLDPAGQDNCAETVQPASFLSRAKLSQLINLPTPSPKAQVLQILQEPYCRFPPVFNLHQQVTDREAYPLEFDPKVWLVIQYQGSEYIGYEFSFREKMSR